MNEYDVLKGARDRVTHGWYQDLAGTGEGHANGCVCLYVAVGRAAYDNGDGDPTGVEFKVVRRLASLIKKEPVVNYLNAFNTITNWNDTRGRKFQEVIDLLDTAMSQVAPSGLDTSS